MAQVPAVAARNPIAATTTTGAQQPADQQNQVKAQGRDWAKITAVGMLVVGSLAGVAVIAGVVSAVAGSKNVFLMGDSVGFTTQPLSFSATIGTLAAAGTAIGAAGLLIGGGIWFHRIRKAEEAAEQAEAAAQRLLNERLTPGHANFDAVFANECIANNVILDLDVSSPAYSKQKLLTFLTTVGALTDANKAKLLGELAAAHADATRAVKLTAQEIAAFDAHFKAAKVAVPVV